MSENKITQALLDEISKETGFLLKFGTPYYMAGESYISVNADCPMCEKGVVTTNYGYTFECPRCRGKWEKSVEADYATLYRTVEVYLESVEFTDGIIGCRFKQKPRKSNRYCSSIYLTNVNAYNSAGNLNGGCCWLCPEDCVLTADKKKMQLQVSKRNAGKREGMDASKKTWEENMYKQYGRQVHALCVSEEE